MSELGPEPRSSTGPYPTVPHDAITLGGLAKVIGLITFVGGIVATGAVGHYRIGQLEKEHVEVKAEVKEMQQERSRGAADIPLLKAEVVSMRAEQASFKLEMKDSMRELRRDLGLGPVRRARGDGQ